MAAPSERHEARVHALRDLGYLSGHITDFRLSPWLRPDVALRDPNRFELFVADAKTTERPSNADTLSRLRGYMSALVPWRSAGFAVRFALAVDSAVAASWTLPLADLASSTGGVQRTNLTSQDAVVWIDLTTLRARKLTPIWRA